MSFNLSFADIRVNIISSSGDSSSSFLSGVRHCNGRIEAGEISNHIYYYLLVIRFFSSNIVCVLLQPIDLSNFSGTIILTEDLLQSSQRSAYAANFGSLNERKGSVASPEEESVVTVDAVPEQSASRDIAFDAVSALKHNGYSNFVQSKIQDPHNPHQKMQTHHLGKIQTSGSITVENIYTHSNENIQTSCNVTVDEVDTNCNENIMYSSEKIQTNGIITVDNLVTNSNETVAYDKLSFHEACASEDVTIEELHMRLRRNPDAASLKDQFGDYPAHIFANNDVFIYTADCDEVLVEFLMELYSAYPGGKRTYFFVSIFCRANILIHSLLSAFFAEGRSGQIPFGGAIVDWIDDCHQLYRRDRGSVYRVSELKTLSNSDRVINDLCVRREVQMLSKLPERG
jgi:hypothetical protein